MLTRFPGRLHHRVFGPDGHRDQFLARQILPGQTLHVGRRHVPDAVDVLADDRVVEAAEDVLDRDVGDAEGAVQHAHHLARHHVLDQLQLLFGHRLRAQAFDLAVDLLQGGLRDVGPDLRGHGEVARAFEVDHRGDHAVGESVAFAEVLHQPRPEIPAEGRGHDLHAHEIGMLPREEEPSEAQRRLHGPGMFDEDPVLGHGCREGFPDGVSARGDLLGKGRDGGHLVRPDAAAADDEAVFGGVVAAVECHDVVAREEVVGALVGRDAVGVRCAEEGPGKGLAGPDVDLRALDREALAPLGGIDAQLPFGKCRAEEDLPGHVERLIEELREGGEIDVGVVAVDVHVVPRAVVVELFGNLLRRHAGAALREEVRGGRGREGHLLAGRSGAEDERDAQHPEVVRGQRVEVDAVAQGRAPGLLEFDLRGCDDGLRGHGLQAL